MWIKIATVPIWRTDARALRAPGLREHKAEREPGGRKHDEGDEKRARQWKADAEAGKLAEADEAAQEIPGSWHRS